VADDAILLPYQRAWVDDRSRFKIAMWARQTGKSFASTLEPVLETVEERRTWVYLSVGERQAKELAEKAKLHLDAVQTAADALEDYFLASDGTRYTQLEYRLPNGSRHIFLPANPDTARGYTASVVLDEFAFHKDSRAIWTALFPSITRHKHLKVRVMSTPNGASPTNMFYRLWTGQASLKAGQVWSKHRVDIHDAVRMGLAVDPGELRAGLADELAWAQEYELQFLDETTAFLPYDLIESCEHPQATIDAALEEIDRGQGDLYLGMDIGRRRDLSVIWLLQVVGDVAWTRKVIELEKTPFRVQREVLYGLLPHVRRACIDETGIGMQLAEEARTRFAHVEPVTFTNAVKADLATTLRRRFEDKALRIPIDQRIREDLHSVKRVVTSAGNIRFDADADDGHADRFWGLALAEHARSSHPYAAYTSARVGFARGGLGVRR